ncbi:Six-hairpin glycosidase-like protein [Aspergillus recurvatus]
MSPPWESKSNWIWLPEYDDTCNPGKIVLFRREFDLSERDTQLTIRVSADSRYRLFLNGHSISAGPCKGTPLHWNYETVNATPWTRKGKNVLAAQVLRYSPLHIGNTNVMRARIPGFILLAESNECLLPTDDRWRCLHDKSVSLRNSPMDPWLSINEAVHGPSRYFGWTRRGFDDSNWAHAMVIPNNFPEPGISILPWELHERTIPPLTEIPKRFGRVLHIREYPDEPDPNRLTDDWNALLKFGRPLTIPSRSTCEVDIAAHEYSTGYLQFSFRGGSKALVRHLSAESYALEERTLGHWNVRKGDRMDFLNGHLGGVFDSYLVAGREAEHYEPFWFRTFRVLRVSVETQEEPLVISDLSYRETNYPLEIAARFHSPEPVFAAFWDISLRTLKNCMHETYEDCPYYEQSQFPFDTRIQMLFTYLVSNDDRLIRKAIHDFHTSLRPDGLIAMHYPADSNVVLPAFSLSFPSIVHDYLLYKGTAAVVKRYFPTIKAILAYFERQLTPDGLVGQFSPRHWSFVDWVEGWDFGTPPAARQGPGTYFSLLYAIALQSTAWIAEFLGHQSLVKECMESKEMIISAVNKYCFNGSWYLDGPITNLDTTMEAPHDWLSQHCQIYAILAGAIKGPAAQALMKRTLHSACLRPVSLAQKFYLFTALDAVGLYHLAHRDHLSLFDPWQRMIMQNLDTWPEEEHRPRSDCHGWSAAPLYEIVTHILGLKPGAPGFSTAEITPRPAFLEEVDASLPTPKGLVHVRWAPDRPIYRASQNNRRVRLSISGPPGLQIKLNLIEVQGARTVTFTGFYEGDMNISLIG